MSKFPTPSTDTHLQLPQYTRLKHQQFCTVTLAYIIINPHLCYICHRSNTLTPTCKDNRIVPIFAASVGTQSAKYKISYEHLSPGLIRFRFFLLCNKGAPEVPPTCHVHHSPESSFHC